MFENYGKRVLSFLMALAMVFSMFPVQAFATEEEPLDHDHCEVCGQHDCVCPPEEAEHICEFVAGDVVQPDCGNAGYTVYTCEGCGAEENRDEVAATGAHAYVEAVVGPTEETQGYTVHTCSVCGDSYQDNFVDPIVVEEPAAEEPQVEETEEAAEEETLVEDTVVSDALNGQIQREIPEDWTDEMKEIQEMIDIALEDWLVWYGFEMPDQDKFADLIRAQINEEEIPEELAEEWEEIRAQIEDVVVNEMTDNERENATTPIKEVEYLLTVYTDEGLITEEQLEELAVFNPVYLDFENQVCTFGVEPEQLTVPAWQIGLDVTGKKIAQSWLVDSTTGSHTDNGNNTITITAKGDGGLVSNSGEYELTLKNVVGRKAALFYTIDQSALNGGTITTSKASGTEIDNNAYITITVKTKRGSNTSTVVVKDIYLKGTVDFAAAEGGSYTITGGGLEAALVDTENVTNTSACGTEYTLTATPADGYKFVGWYCGSDVESALNATVSSTKTTDTFPNSGNCTVVPKFTQNVTTVTFNAPTGDGSYTVNGEAVAADTQMTEASYALVATPATDADKFVHWYDEVSGTVLSTAAVFDFVPDSEVEAYTVYPVFEDLATYAITVEYDAAGGTVTGNRYPTGVVGKESTLTATPNSGWTFLGWTDTSGKILSTANPYTFAPTADVTLKAAFANSNGAAWFKVDGTHLFNDLNAAAAAGTKIVLAADGTLPAGDYTIPNGDTLLIPRSTDEKIHTTPPLANEGASLGGNDFNESYISPSAFRTLHMASGANITVSGIINVAGAQYAGGRPVGGVHGPVGFIKMGSGSKITVNSGAKLYAWGYVMGSGEVEILSGGTVYESFQVMDWRGGDATTQYMDNEKRVFPLSQYYIQNVEVPMKLWAGAIEQAYTSTTASRRTAGIEVPLVGPNSLFTLESGYLIKDYDESNDRQSYKIYGNVAMDRILIEKNFIVMNIRLDSQSYVLPITNNLTVDVVSGTIGITADLAFLPGSEIIVREGATCNLANGKSVYVYDYDEWSAAKNKAGRGFVAPEGCEFIALSYAPGRKGSRTGLTDAKIQIDGLVNADAGFLYTTTGGAIVTSTGTGVVKMKAGTATVTHQGTQNSSNTPEYWDVPVQVAKLQNAAGKTPATTDPDNEISPQGTTYTYTDGVWVPECNTADGVSGCEKVLKDETKDFSCVNPYICRYCKTEMETKEHTPGAAATCTAAQVCTVEGCTYVFESQLAHNYQPVDGKADSCKTGVSGYKASYICQTSDVEGQYCGKHFADQDGTMIGDGSDAAWEAWTKDPDGGLVDDVQHTDGDVGKQNVKTPTCTEDGSHDEVLYCASCGEVIKTTTGVVDAATGHNYGEWTIVEDSTCYREGSKKQVCANNCGIDNTGVIEKKPHTPGVPATCTTGQVCTVAECKATIVAALGHEPGDPVNEPEQEDGSYYIVVKCAREGCGYEISRNLFVPGADPSHTGLRTVERVEPTCEEPGMEAGWECVDPGCSVCGGKAKSGMAEIPAKGHSLEDAVVSYSWNDDYSKCTATGNCANNCGKTHSVTTEEISSDETEATCAAAGKITYTATFAEDTHVAKASIDVAGDAKLTHDWNEATYQWSDDNTICTATITCKHNTTPGCILTATVSNIVGVETSPSCETNGYVSYSADFAEYWAAKQTKEVIMEDSATGHTWTVVENSDVWNLKGEEKTCTVDLVCENDSTHEKTVNLEVEYEIKKQDTCTQAGEILYTAAFKAEGKDTMPDPLTTDEELDEVQHIWSEISYDWSEDYSTCTASRTCSRNMGEACTETEKVMATPGTNSATCTEGGKIVHTTESFTNQVFKVQTKEQTTDPLGHDVENGFVDQVNPTCQNTGVEAHFQCTRDDCGLLFRTEEDAQKNATVAADDLIMATVGHDYQYSYNQDATCLADGTNTVTCKFGCSYNKTETAAGTMLNHVWGEYTYVEGSATCQNDGVKRASCTRNCGTSDEVTVEGTKLDHKYTDLEVLEKATCTKAGRKKVICVNGCNSIKTETITELGHVYAEQTGQAATCYAEGWKNYYQCAGDDETRTYCDLYFANKDDTTSINLESWKTGDGKLSKVDHEYEPVVTAPTCLEQGYTTYTCKNCPGETEGHSYVADYQDALNHDYDTVGEITTQPTCTTAGVRTFTCQNSCCTAQTEGHTKTEPVDPLGHNLVKIDGQASTCDAAGYNDYWMCAAEKPEAGTSERSYCGYYFASEKDTAATATPIATTEDALNTWKTTLGENGGAIAQLEHEDTDKDHLCDQPGCDDKLTECEDKDQNHNCDYTGCNAVLSECVDNVKDHFCDYTGCKKELSKCADVDTDQDHLCDHCGQPFGDHVFQNGTCNCGYVQDLKVTITIVAEGQTDQKLDDETIKYLNNGQDYTKTLNLKEMYNAPCYTILNLSAKVNGEEIESDKLDNTLTIASGLLTGDVEIVVEAHQNHQTDAAHTNVTIKAPTCVDSGEKKTVITCKNCGAEYDSSTEVLPATDHDWEKSYVDPTFDADGYTQWHCKNDSSHDYKEIDEDTKLIAVARIGSTRYQTLKEAIEAAGNRDTIELLAKCVVEDTQVWDKNITMLIPAVDDNYGLVIKGDLTIKRGTFVVNGFYGIGVTGRLTIDGGTFELEEEVDNDYLIGSWGTTVINGGTFEGQYNCVNAFQGAVEIKGGNFTTADKDCTGEWDSSDVLAEDVGTAVITSGTFSKSVKDYLAEGHCQREVGGKYYVAPHSSGETKQENIKPATCTDNGSYDSVTYCTRCDAQISRENKTIDALGHTVEVIAGKEADCLNPGYHEAYHCTVCGGYYATRDTENDKLLSGKIEDLTAWQTTGEGKIDALGHELGHTAEVPAACETSGLKEYWQCSRCGAAFEDEGENTPIADLATWKAEGGDGYLPATDHNYTSEVTTQPTCTEDGVRTYTCQNDKSHTYTETVSKLNHNYQVEYKWNEDRSACTAYVVCANDIYDQAQLNASVSVTVTTAADCENDGAGIRTAAFPVNNYGIEDQVEDVVIPKTGHSFTKYVSDNNATCTEDGTKTAVCDNKCGQKETVEDVGSAKGHNMDEIAAVDATCTKDGIIHHYQCKACLGRFYDEKGQQPIEQGKHIAPALKHDYQTTVTDPDCENQGYTTYTCSRGDHTYKDNFVDALGHDYKWEGGKIVTDPTCTEDGFTTYDCSRCDETHIGDQVDATGHDYENLGAKSGTCTEPGWKTVYKCRNSCGLYYEWVPEQQAYSLIGDETALEAWKTGAGQTNAYGHNWREVAGQTPDCDDAGYLKSYECIRSTCGLHFSEKENDKLIGDGSQAAYEAWIAEGGAGYLKPNGHTEGEKRNENFVKPKCEVDGSHEEVTFCGECKLEINRVTVTDDATGHQNINPKDGKKPSCTTTGYEAYWQCDDCKVMFSDAEGENVITERVVIDATGHTEVTDEAVEATCNTMGKSEGKHCSVCGTITVPQVDQPMKNHVLTEIISTNVPTCTEDGNQVVGCINCDYETTEVLPATGHVNKEKIPAKKPSCTTAGATEGLKCACGEILEAPEEVPATGHDYKWEGGNVVTNPTCTERGYTTHTCSVCGDVIKDTYTDMVPHTEVEDAAVPATCTTTGLTAGKHCSACGAVTVKQQVIQLAPHTEVIDGKVNPTCTETGLTEGKHCSVCGETLIAQKVVPAKGHQGFVIKGQAAKCEVDGWKDYYQCGNGCKLFFEDLECTKPIENVDAWKIAEDGGKIAQLGHAWDEGRVTTLPTCTEDGVKTFTCGNCNGTKTEAEPALGHDAVPHAAQHPTYYSAGWGAYETCTRCDHNTLTPIEALGEPSVHTYEEFMTSLKLLEEYANAYVKANPGKDPMLLLIKYVRTGVDRYNSGSWNIMAGYEDEGFAKYVMEQEETYNKSVPNIEDMINVTGIKNIANFDLPNGDSVDFGHMFGTMDITYHNKTSINHADVAGWAGDLVDLLSTADRHYVTGTVDEMIKIIGEQYLNHSIEGESDQFSQTDMYGDLDGYYFMNELISEDYEPGMLYSMMEKYFVSSLTIEQRADYFLKNRLGGVTGRSEIREAVFSEYLGNSVIATLEGTREFNQTDVSDMRKACCYAFADYLCKLAGDYVELGDNPYFSVFSTDLSTLAPGITQQISKATTADGKQVVYYTATADVKSPYVSVYANYKDNDPTLGWGMQRVMDQANAAQAKYGNPASDKYIPNYNVIAAINGAGYNMTTGEPSGILVMNGVEYHKPNGDGFVGILKDGSAYIGTDAEYYEMMEQGLISEAISGFGTVLVKDGKINVTANSSYFNDRASRTAFGITKTGKVVFMVMDGRQEPVSCGGSMVEIAQVMLEAGCVQAINLDGGGSTTYVARKPGDEELSLISSPSDGFQRSVSTSLFMVSTAPSSTEFDKAILDSNVRHVTIGATAQLTASAVSAMGNAVDLPEGTTWAVSDSSIATISQDGVLTGVANGTVNVNLMLDGKVVGTRAMYVVVPDTVYFSKENMNAVYGEPAKLPVAALFEGKPVAITENDVTFSLSNAVAGTTEGYTFIGNEASNVKAVRIYAHAVFNPDAISGSMNINLFKPGETSFDFDNAVGGDRLLAWERVVSNSTTVDEITYNVVDKEKPMVTEYSFGMDMTQIPMPEELVDLVYMLPGADVEGNNSAWDFLLQLAERVSVLTEVKATIQMDPRFDVDYSKMSVVCEYFNLEKTELDPETNELILSLRWKDQTKAIDPDTANPIVILSGIKLTPKADADWGAKDQLAVVNTGNISYDIYLRANALYSFASKPENQEAFKLYPFVNKDVIIGGAPESGGHFLDTYKEFKDEYTLIKGMKNGWVYEDGGYAYYVDDVKNTGVQKVGPYYYDFGNDGINMGQTKYTGMFQIDEVNYYSKEGLLSGGWHIDKDDKYYFDETGKAVDGEVVLDEVKMIFDNGLLIGGQTGFVKKANGNTYYYQNGDMYYGWLELEDKWYHFNTENGIMTVGDGTANTKLFPDQEAKAKGAYYVFDAEGHALYGFPNNFGYYYWAGQPIRDEWVRNGYDLDGWYHTNGNGHFVTTPDASKTKQIELNGVTYTAVVIAYDGVEYTFDNNSGKLLLGSKVLKDNKWYYYWAGEPVNDGWFEYNGDTYYAFADGHLATGSNTIDGKPYMFEPQGALIKDGITLSVTMSADFSKMTIKTNPIKDVSYVKMAVWSEASNQNDMAWFTATKDANGVWTAVVPMCQYKNVGTYQIHTYEFDENESPVRRLVNTTYEVTKAGHIADKGVKENVVAATCTTDGSYDLVIRCTACEEILEKKHITVPATGHKDADKNGACDACGESLEEDIETIAMHRLYNPNTGEHFYTGSVEEREMLVAAGWNYEGIAWNAPVTKGAPIYRVFNPNSGDHHYTGSAEERDMLVEIGWQYEGVAWNTMGKTAHPQYRMYNPNADIGSHHYTGSVEERDYLVSLGWHYEGIGWYGC